MIACPFCRPNAARVFHDGPLVLGLWDGFPVSPGHALLVPRRHVSSWFDATADERLALLAATDLARARIEERHRPDGYTIGVNVGAAGGQTVPHLHVHVIPRYAGDVPDPAGGVRLVIPDKGKYRVSRVCRDCRWYTYSICDGGRCSHVLEVPAPWPWTAPECGWPRSGDEDASECESYEEESDGTSE